MGPRHDFDVGARMVAQQLKIKLAGWHGIRVLGDYCPTSAFMGNVEDIIDNQEIHESSTKPQREIREFHYGRTSSSTVKYMLLAADMTTKVGFMHAQPWFVRSSNMLQSDLSSDWSEPLDFIVENDGLQNGPDSAIDERNHYRGSW